MDTTTNITRMERQRVPVEQGVGDSLSDNQTYLNRYSLALTRMETAAPCLIVPQVMESIESAENGFGAFLADAIRRRDEKLVGKLIMKALDLYRHRIADAEADV